MSVDGKAVICCIAKDEELYIDEWIAYHLKLGFDGIYVYDNSTDGRLESLSARYQGYVHVTHFPGQPQQMNAYRHFLREHSQNHTWVAFIDVDEFIVLRKHLHIHAFLEEMCGCGSVALNWLYFGSNGLETYDDRPVLERFTKCGTAVSPYIKVIAKIEDIDSMPEPHFVRLRESARQRFMNGETCKGTSMYTPGGSVDALPAVLHHYFTKSRAEFEQKMKRGRACDAKKYDMSWFHKCDQNQVTNTQALDVFRTRSLPPIPKP